VIKAGTAIRQPLRNARVELIGGSSASSPTVVRTDANGQFVFRNLMPGQYTLGVTCDGFIRQQSPAKIVVAREQPPVNVMFELEPAPIAAGWVLDTNGEPFANVMVEALRRGYDTRGNRRLARAARAVTDDRGEYRIFWLDPGEYFFYATSIPTEGNEVRPSTAVVPTYFPGVSTPEDAKPVRLDIGREVRVDFRLRAAGLWEVAGHTMEDVSGKPLAASITVVPPGADPSFSQFHAQSPPTGPFAGEFLTGGVPPGSYIVVAKSKSNDQELIAYRHIELRPVLIAPPGGYGMTLPLAAPLSMNGRILVDTSAAVYLRQSSIMLISTDPDLPSPRNVFPRIDGQFTLNGILPGSYLLDISGLPQDLYLKDARFGEQHILEEPMTIEKRLLPTALQILLASDGGRLQITVRGAKDQPRSGAQVVLVPDLARRSRREQHRVATSDGNGQATLRGIPPGMYKIFAWENLEPNAYLNADYLQLYEELGVPVKIRSGMNPPVTVRSIPDM
jgi:protocatechuate 3,4-dioxygenase beta subunit